MDRANACCAQPLVLSHIRGLLADRSETEAEAQAAAAAGGSVPVPKRATGAERRVVPRTSAPDAFSSGTKAEKKYFVLIPTQSVGYSIFSMLSCPLAFAFG